MFQDLDQVQFNHQNDVQNIRYDIEELDEQLEQLKLEENALKEKNINQDFQQQSSLQQPTSQNQKNPSNNQSYKQFPDKINCENQDLLYNDQNLQPANLNRAQKQDNYREQAASQYKYNQNQGGEDNELKELKHKLRTLFTFYASFGDRINVDFLKSNNFHKMMVDAKLRDNYLLTQNRLDLMFIKENKHKLNMEFDTFLNLLAKIADMKYSNAGSSAEALNLLLQNHFLPLYENIINETDLGEDESKFKEEIDENTLLVMKNIIQVIQKIYYAYFPWEPKVKFEKNKIKQQSEKALFQFLKDFDICPTLVTKSTAYLLFSEITEIPVNELCYSAKIFDLTPYIGADMGNVLTFSRFCIYLIRIGNICHQNFYNNLNQPDINIENVPTFQKFQFLLERMELSQGFINLQKLLHVPINSQTSLILKKKVLGGNNNMNRDQSPFRKQQPRSMMKSKSELGLNNQQHTKSMLSQFVQKDNFIDQSGNEKQQSGNSLYNQMQFQGKEGNRSQFNNENNQGEMQDFKSVHQYQTNTFKCPQTFLQEESFQLFEKYQEQLLKIYQIYCSFGDPTNTTRMRSSKFQKLLKDCGLINQNQRPGSYLQQKLGQEDGQNNESDLPILYIEDIDLIFVKLLNNKKKEFDISQFYLALEMIALRLFGMENLQNGLQHILDNYILKLLEKDCNIKSNNQYIQVLMEILQDQTIVELLGLVHRSIMNYYKYYSEKNGIISYEKFEKFAKDFGIFPEILPKAKLFKIFSTLSQIYQSTEIQSTNSQFASVNKSNTSRPISNDNRPALKIDQHLFVESLALCAFEIQFSDPQPSNIEKICYLLERMNHSEGPKVVQRALGVTRCQNGINWDLLAQVRKKYPYLFVTNDEQEVKTVETFDQIMKQKINM